MHFQRAWANARHRSKSFESDRFGKMATHPVEHSDEIGGQGSRWCPSGDPVVVRLIRVVALIHTSGLARLLEANISQRDLHSAAEIG